MIKTLFRWGNCRLSPSRSKKKQFEFQKNFFLCNYFCPNAEKHTHTSGHRSWAVTGAVSTRMGDRLKNHRMLFFHFLNKPFAVRCFMDIEYPFSVRWYNIAQGTSLSQYGQLFRNVQQMFFKCWINVDWIP